MDIFLMVFPHYYLNYDMSKSIYQFSFGQIFACRGFRDWHNAKASLNKNINEYLISKEMFGKKLGIYESTVSSEEVELPRSWKVFYEETCDENKKIMIDILEMPKEKKTILIVLPILIEIVK